MKSLQVLPFLLLLAAASPTHATPLRAAKPPAFVLAGDSTTAIQAANGGGWGNGFLSFLISPATGVNKGHNGATTKSFVEGGDWDQVKGLVAGYREEHDVFVTIQFGHNDQKETSGVTLEQYEANLKALVGDVRAWGGTPILITPLTRRTFTTPHEVQDSLHAERLSTISAAASTGTTYLDLNLASITYVNAIGEEAAHAYNLKDGDNTHLNEWGSVVFGRIVADLLLGSEEGKERGLDEWIGKNETLSGLIREGLPA